MRLSVKDGATIPVWDGPYGAPEAKNGMWLVLQEDGTPIGCLTEVDTDEGYVIQQLPGEEPRRIEGKFRVVITT